MPRVRSTVLEAPLRAEVRRVPMKEKTCACGRTWLTRGGQEKCPPCRLVIGETILPLLDPDHDEKTEPSDWNALTLDEEGFPF